MVRAISYPLSVKSNPWLMAATVALGLMGAVQAAHSAPVSTPPIAAHLQTVQFYGGYGYYPYPGYYARPYYPLYYGGGYYGGGYYRGGYGGYGGGFHGGYGRGGFGRGGGFGGGHGGGGGHR